MPESEQLAVDDEKEVTVVPEPDPDPTVEPVGLAELDEGQIRLVRFDRSQSRLRMPTAMVAETLRIVNNLSFPDTTIERIENLDQTVVDVLIDNDVLVDDGIDPMAEAMLSVVNQASLMISLDLHYGSDTSHRTIWATPRQAVVSNEVEANLVELQPADVGQLPFVLHQMMLAGSPRFVGPAPISIATEAVVKSEKLVAQGQADEATSALTEAGLSEEQARIVLSFEPSQVRRWRIASAWSTDSGQESRELRGIDADTNGQWLVAMTGSRGEDRGQITFTPQGHGDIMRSLRAVLPRVWLGRPLSPPSL